MQILHFSTTPLAGAPLRVVRTLQQHLEHSIRLVDAQENIAYGSDLVFSRDRDEVLALAETADILHLHNYVHLDSRAFAPIDFRALHERGTRIIRHFYSAPETVMRHGQLAHNEVFDDLPALVIGQFHERYYPAAHVVPLALPTPAPASGPGQGVFFGPTTLRDMFQSRWDTKGARETRAVIQRACRRSNAPFHFVHGKSLAESLAAKRQSAIVVDELVTGSYHLSAMEGAALGRATLVWLDSRTRRVLEVIAGTETCPFINVHLNEAEATLVHLLKDSEETRQIGETARAWFDRYWNPAQVASAFDTVYNALMESPDNVKRQPELALDTPAAVHMAITFPNEVHAVKQREWWGVAPIGVRLVVGARVFARWSRRVLKRIPVLRALDRVLPHG